MHSRSTSPLLLKLLAALIGLSLVAAACGGGDDDDGSGGGGTTDTTAEDTATPVPGGKLVYGLEAETSSPWTPANAVCAISCHMVMRSVFDTLTMPDENGEIVGNLAKTIEHNADYTEWTFTLRDGITFHDGTPLDGAAVADNIERARKSFLTGKALADVAAVKADGMKVIVTTAKPWTMFPMHMSGQVGYIASPTWLKAVDADPSKATQPVGTGPFVFDSYKPFDHFRAKKNPNYWRKGLPYLDEIEYRVYENVQSRTNALLSGEIQVMHTSNGDEVAKLKKDGSVELYEAKKYGETGYIMLNVGDPSSPLSDVRVRRALAMATNNEAISKARTAGQHPPANGPFPPGTPGYLEDSGYPKYDLEGAKKLVAEIEKDKGPIKIQFHTTNDEFNLVTNQLIQSMWKEAGIDAELAQREQGVYIVDALKGDFQAFAWRNHGGFDPDAQNFWWNSVNAQPKGQFALNFGRINDPQIDKLLDAIRTSADKAARTKAAEDLNRRFGEQVYNLWNTWVVWGIAYNPKVHQVVTGFELPDGGQPLTGGGVGGVGGSHQVAQIWSEK